MMLEKSAKEESGILKVRKKSDPHWRMLVVTSISGPSDQPVIVDIVELEKNRRQLRKRGNESAREYTNRRRRIIRKMRGRVLDESAVTLAGPWTAELFQYLEEIRRDRHRLLCQLKVSGGLWEFHSYVLSSAKALEEIGGVSMYEVKLIVDGAITEI